MVKSKWFSLKKVIILSIRLMVYLLLFVGTKKVRAVSQSVNKMRHSYTVMPTIDSSGRLLSPLFIVLQETGGVFGPIVKDGLFQAENIYVTASVSELIGKPQLKVWLQDVLLPNVHEKAVQMIDSWSTYKNKELLDSVMPEGQELKIVTVPPGSTGICQPLDIFFFRMWKDFVRKIWDRVVEEERDTILHLRNNVLKLQSLVHNQFSSPRYSPMWSVGWSRPGYSEQPDFKHVTPSQFCFNNEDAKLYNRCGNAGCLGKHFLTCAWCKEAHCFKCFFVDYHYCTYVN